MIRGWTLWPCKYLGWQSVPYFKRAIGQHGGTNSLCGKRPDAIAAIRRAQLVEKCHQGALQRYKTPANTHSLWSRLQSTETQGEMLLRKCKTRKFSHTLAITHGHKTIQLGASRDVWKWFMHLPGVPTRLWSAATKVGRISRNIHELIYDHGCQIRNFRRRGKSRRCRLCRFGWMCRCFHSVSDMKTSVFDNLGIYKVNAG